MDLNLCISHGTVSTKIYDKRDDFDFDIVNFPFLDGDVPRRTDRSEINLTPSCNPVALVVHNDSTNFEQ